MKAIDEEILDAYVRSLTKAAEYQNKFINPVELKALIRRFMTLNTDVDPRVIDWVGVWDDRLTYSEQAENFKLHYPMYKWSPEKPIDEEAFEKAKEGALWEMIRGLDDEELKKLAQLIQLLLDKLQKEQKMEPAVQVISQVASTMTNTTPPTQQPAEPKITLKVLAGVPVLLEARAFASAFSVEDLCNNSRILRGARGRINASLFSEDFVWPFGDPLEDLLEFHLAVVVLSQIRDRRVWERFAEAEARRAEDFMAVVDDGVLEAIWKDLLIRAGKSERDEEERTGLPYRIHVADYMRLIKGIDGAEWKLENRTFQKGWVYLSRDELIRLISEEVKARILRMLEKTKVDRVPEPMMETVEKIKVMLEVRFAKATDKQTLT